MGMTFEIQAGARKCRLSSADQIRNKQLTIYARMTDETLGHRFYAGTTGETLVDLLDLHRSAKTGKRVSDLPRLYSDLGNLADFIVKANITLALGDFDLRMVEVVDNENKAIEKETTKVQTLLDQLDPAGFAAWLESPAEAGAIFGTMYAALHKDGARWWAYTKEPLAVYPQFTGPEPTGYFVSYSQYEADRNTPHKYVEYYDATRVEIWKDGTLLDEADITGGPLLIAAPWWRSRGEWYGRSVLSGLVEAITEACGYVGSSLHIQRQMATISVIGIPGGLSAIEPDKRRQDTVDSIMLDPDTAVLYFADTRQGQVSSTTVQAPDPGKIATLLAEIRGVLCAKSPVYALWNVGGNMSGRALELLMTNLRADVKRSQRGVGQFIRTLAETLLRLEGHTLTGRVIVRWPQLLAPSPTVQADYYLKLVSSGIVDSEYAAEQMGIDYKPIKQRMESQRSSLNLGDWYNRSSDDGEEGNG